MSTPSPWKQWFSTPKWTTNIYNYYNQSIQNCRSPYYTYDTALGNFHGQTGFYSLADSYSNGVLSDLSWDNTQKLFRYIYYGNGATIDIIDEANSQAGAIISESVGGFFVLLCAIFAICFFIKKCVCCCCCTKKNQQVRTFLSTRPGYLTQIVLYLILFGFITAGTIIYGLSVDDLNNGINWSSYSLGNPENYWSGIRDLDCNYISFASNFNQQQVQVQQNPNSLTNYWLTSSGVTPLTKFDTNGYDNDLGSANRMGYQLLTSLGKLKTNNQQCRSQIDSLTKLIGKLNSDTHLLQNILPVVQNQINITSKNANSKGAKFNMQLQVPTATQSDIFNQVANRIFAMNQGLNLASNNSKSYTDTVANFISRGITQWQNNGKQDSVRIVSLLVVLIPMSLILLSMIIAFITCIFRFVFPKLHIPIILTGPVRLFINIGAYTVIFTAWAIWLVALSYYWVSNPFATTCYQVEQPAQSTVMMSFYNQYYKINYVPYTPISSAQPLKRTMQYGRFLSSLQYQQTLFSTLDGDSSFTMFNTSTVSNDLNIDYYQQWTNNVIYSADLTVSYDYATYNTYQARSDNFTTDSTQLNSLMRDGFLNECNQDDTESVQSSLISYTRLVGTTQQKNLELLNDQKNVYNYDIQYTRNVIQQQNRYNFDNLQDNTNYALQKYRNKLTVYIYPAQAISAVYESTWNVVCSQIRSPLDGIWASAGMLAIFMIPAGFLLYKTARVVVEKKKPVARNAETNVNEQCFATTPIVVEHPAPIVFATVPNPVMIPPPMVNSFTTITVVDQINNPQPSAPAMYPTIDPNAMNNIETIPMKY